MTIKIDDHACVAKTLKSMGYKVTKPRPRNSNGVDIYAIKEDRVLSVEIKTANPAKKDGNVLRVRKVERNRLLDDLIAIVLPCGYVLIEPMKHHLLACNKQGDRFLNY